MPDGGQSHAAGPLGQALVEAGLLTLEGLERALGAARDWNVPLGQAVLALGLVRPRAFYRALATHLRLGFVDVLETPPPRMNFRIEELDFYLEAACIPVARDTGAVMLAAPDPFHAALVLARFRATGRPAPEGRANFCVTARLDVMWTLQDVFETELRHRARLSLAETDPDHSAYARAPAAMRRAALAGGAVLAGGLALAPGLALGWLNLVLGAFFSLLIGIKALAIPYGLMASRARKLRRAPAIPPDAALPVYTILVPLRDEAEVLPLLAQALREIDYPPAKLDIKLVIEGDDVETLAKAKALGMESHVEFVRVPPGEPRTKPKACNHALMFARGEYLVIYDAEDQPDPMQLKKAVAAFRQAPPEVACLQASLSFFNSAENWLTSQFTVEFNTWFDLVLPTAERLGMPIPLGGTSTHFRTDILRAVGAWDPYNVTEDADLGIRLAQKGYRCQVLDSTTHEEANCVTGNWIRQRSRWIKGYMQTWLVHMRHPLEALRRMGPAGFFGFQVLIGGSIASALAHPLVWIAAMAGLALDGSALAFVASGEVPALLMGFNLSLLAGGYVISVAAGITAVLLRGAPRLVLQAPMMLFYWPLISLAAYKALVQLVTRPHFWEKTDHAISRDSRAQLARLRQAAKTAGLRNSRSEGRPTGG